MTEKVRQNRLRAAVLRRGYVLQGSRALGADHPERSRWRIVPEAEKGSRKPYTLSLDDVERWLSRAGRRPPQRGRYVLPDALHVSGSAHAPGKPEREILSAATGDTRVVMAEVLALWTTSEDTIVDVTFGRGSMWPAGRAPSIKHDLALDGVDLRALPEADGSAGVVVLDPPYRPRHGGDGAAYERAYRLHESGLESVDDVLGLYRDGLVEAHRVLQPGGRVIVKCSDLTVSGRLRLVHLDVLAAFDAVGFEFADMFVVVNTSRVPSRGTQQRARRAHSYLLVGVRS